MRAMTIFGSPKRIGNTGTVLGWVEDELAAGGHQSERVDVCRSPLKGCLGCYKCQTNPDQPACAQKDGGNELFARMLQADLLLFATPLYGWSFSAQLKSLLDRCFCLVTGYETGNPNSLLAGKTAALLVTCGGAIEGNADLIQENFVRFAGWSKCQAVDSLVIPGCTTPEALGEDVQAKAHAWTRTITAAAQG